MRTPIHALRAAVLALLLPTTAAAMFPMVPPNDPLWPNQEQLHAAILDVEGAWLTTIGDRSVVVAVLDSGADYDHEDVITKYYLNMAEVGPEMPVPDANGNGFLDLFDTAVLTPTDGLDNDGNGYVDDFSGWDFDDDDNDEDDALDYGHGSGRIGIIAAATDNGLGIAGVCPECALMSVRVADTFVVSADDLARSVVFAADAGAQVVNMALGSLGNSRMLREAFAYGVSKGVVYCASIGNQWSFHHHWPASYEDMIAMGALDPVTTIGPWAERANYSDYGAHLVFTSPSDTLTTNDGGGYGITSGTSTASPHCSGIAGLLLARAHALDTDADTGNDVGGLTPNEVRQLLAMTATDLVGGREDLGPGWDQLTGYGRMHAARALARVANTTLPPEADLASPGHYAYLDPRVSPRVEVRGRARARHADAGSYTLEYGVGVEPRSWTEVSTGALPQDGLLGRWDIGRLPMDVGAAVSTPQSFTVTLRLRVEDDRGNAGEDRRAVFVRRDVDLLPGFPLDLGSSVESSPALADLDGDGRLEIVLADSDGDIRVLDASGGLRPGWPRQTTAPVDYPDSAAYTSGAVTATGASVVAAPAVADLDGDGCSQEIVIATMRGALEVYQPDGTRLLTVNASQEGFAGAPTLADLDGDGDLEIVAAALDQRLYAYHHDGVPVWPPVVVEDTRLMPAERDRGPIVASPAVADLDGDGSPEIVLGSGEVYDGPNPSLGYGRLYAYHADGTPVSGWPVGGANDLDLGILLKSIDALLPVIAEGVPASPVLVDIDGDGRREILTGTPTGPALRYDLAGTPTPMNLVGGGPASNTLHDSTLHAVGTPVVADLDGDGGPDYLVPTITVDLAALDGGGWFRDAVEFSLSAWSLATGDWLDGFPRKVDDWTVLSSLATADVDGDGRLEVLTPSAGYLLHAFRADGTEPDGWPKFTGGWLSSPAVADLDGDGAVEVLVTTREGKLFAWRTPGRIVTDPSVTGIEPAVRFHHDVRHTGDAHADVVPPRVVLGLDAVRHGGRIHLAFRASGDDGVFGHAAEHAVRHHALAFDCASWDDATEEALLVTGPGRSWARYDFPDPAAGGELHVAVRPRDESSNQPPVYSAVVLEAPAPLLRLSVPPTEAKRGWLPVDVARDVFLTDVVGGPVAVAGDAQPGPPLVVYYEVPAAAAPVLAAKRGPDVELSW